MYVARTVPSMMYIDETPILESVFVDLAPNAVAIADVITEDMSLDEVHWYFTALTYGELVEWAGK